ncbi:site-specific DNA-methyltransferase [Corynebacterium parakroppenstedtii]|uniref:site-specific DNA-methyltransferase n=1 Tax=Corynebacterium parakroppenstedtii TaxID=2828363 RepID=UPI0036F42A78
MRRQGEADLHRSAFNTAQTFAHYEDNLEHSIWLTMMRDRLLHLKKLLADDGSIWVHLDDMEVHRMRLLLDEVFGAENFGTQVVWEKSYSARNDSKGIPAVTDFILVYGNEGFKPNKLARTPQMNAPYSNPDGDPRGDWRNDNISAPGAATHLGMVYGIQHPITGEMMYPPTDCHWRYGRDKMREVFSGWGDYIDGPITGDETKRQQEIVGTKVSVSGQVPPLIVRDFGETSIEYAWKRYHAGNWPAYYLTRGGFGGFGRKTWLADMNGRIATSLFSQNEVGHTDGAKKEVQALFPKQNAFSTPKPERLLERIIHIGSNPGDIVLDVFAGSGTTAAVAQKMGRRWVTCELLESTFTTFTRPRLEKVIKDQDPGGITRTKGERVAADNVELPDGVTPEDAAKFNSVLNKLIADDPDAKKSALVRQLKTASRTKRAKEVVNWRGGGEFQVAYLSPSCFDYDPELDRVILTPEATGDVLVESVAANLGFHLLHADDDYVFDGRRGNSLLKVVEGVATVEHVNWLVSQVQESETIVLAATTVMDGVREHLRRACKGSRVVAIPDDIFRYSEGGDR